MDTKERMICRLCFKVSDSFKAIEGELKGVLDIFLKKIDLTVIQEPMMCTYCAAMLAKCSQFKTTCLYARDCILPFINKDDDLKLNLKKVYLSMNENGIGLSEAQDICGFCMSPVKSCSAISFDVEGGDIMLQNMIEQCLPELDFSLIKKPVICATCHDSLESWFCFVTNCSIVEEKIKKYRDTQDINDRQIELSRLLEFMTKDVTIKVEKKDPDGGEIGNGDKIEQIIFCDVNESVNEDLKIKNESCTEMDDHYTSKNMLVCEGDIKIEKTFCRESQLKEENINVMDQFNEEIDIKTEECDFNRFENGVVLPLAVTTKSHKKQKYLVPHLEGDLSESYIKQKLTDENVSMITYKCDSCLYQTRYKYALNRHAMLHQNPSEVTMYKCKTPKDHSEVTMYKCDSCSFQTKYKQNLKIHSLVHKDPSEVTMYKCSLCSFQTKLKISIKRHILKHKDPSEVTMYKCSLCSFQTKLKSTLKQHNMLKHKDPSEVTMYKCSLCSFQTKLKISLIPHMLKHKDPSEVPMYKCSSCSFQTKLKFNLKPHMLTHKDPSEVTMYKCSLCSFETKLKGSLKRHMLKHKDLSEVTMYKCGSCLYQTKYKEHLKGHLLKHKDPSGVTMYKCDTCLYQTIRQKRLEMHLLTHKDPLEVAVYKCSLCSFQTKLQRSLKQHNMLKHKEEVTMYKCTSCLYQTKCKENLKKHALKHKDPSNVTQ